MVRTTGIQITPEMIAAGRNRLWEWDRDTETASDTALRVYRAMGRRQVG